MSKVKYSDTHLINIFLKILCVFDYEEGILRLWDKHKTRATVNKIAKTLNINYQEYNAMMKLLEPFNVIEEYDKGKKRLIQINESVIDSLDSAKLLRFDLQQGNDKNSNQNFTS